MSQIQEIIGGQVEDAVQEQGGTDQQISDFFFAAENNDSKERQHLLRFARALIKQRGGKVRPRKKKTIW